MTAIFKTSAASMGEVVRLSKYALRGNPHNLEPGDTILISRNALPGGGGAEIQYRMEFVRAYPDNKGEAREIWGRDWAFMIEGRNCSKLKTPFRIRDVQVTESNYGQGGTVAYLHPDDEAELNRRGLLAVL